MKRIYKRSRHPTYKTEKERKQAHIEACRRYIAKNREALKEKARERYKDNAAAIGKAVREYLRDGIDGEIRSLKNKMEDIMKDHEEVLKEVRQLSNFVKWGRKP